MPAGRPSIGCGVIQHQLVRLLHQAGRLFVDRLLEAIAVELDVQASRQQGRSLLQFVGIVIRRRLFDR